MDDTIRRLKELTDASDNIVFFGGAGVSTESGIPDFRSVDGLYHQKFKYPPETMLSHTFYETHTEEFYDFYRAKMLALDAQPNAAHRKLAEWERQGKLKAVITQNIDGLHQKAGSREVLELHGSVLRNHCTRCGKFYGVERIAESRGIPRCTCGGIIKPDVVLYEESLDEDVMARAIHYTSPRKDKPFVSVNCMALNPGVLESELFGHEKGSFTGAVAMRRGRFEQADSGTLFLDEIAELTPDLQVKLLRVLQERRFERVGGGEEIEVDIRVVAATNKDLAALVEKGAFRDDLYYRLNVVQVPLPPLRERREDIPLLVAHFVEKVCTDNSMPPKTFSTEALNYLTGYEWPGNIRQLENVVESCLVLVPGNVIDVDNLPAEIRDEESQFKSAVDLLPVQLDLADTLEKIEAALIRRALVRAELVQVKAAEYLGISKSLLQYKLKKYGITGH